MEKPNDILLLEHEIGGIELFVRSDVNIESSLKLNKTVIIDKEGKIIGLNLSYCKIESLKPLINFRNLEYLFIWLCFRILLI